MTESRRGVAAALGGIWLLVVGSLTLRSAPSMREIVLTTPWTCLVCGIGGATDVVLNLLLFAPFGVLARLAGWRFRKLLLFALLLTCSIELIQGYFLVGRDATLGDVVANSSGAVFGWALLALLGAITAVPRRARVAAAAVLVAQGAVWLGTGIGMRPSLDGPAPWVGRFLRVGNSQDPFEGTLQRVTLDGIPVTMEPMERLPARSDSLVLGIGVTRHSAAPPPRSASLVRLVDATPRAFLRVTQVGQGLNVEVHMPASDLRFRTPSWRFSKALEIPVGEPWQLEWRWHARSVEMISAPTAAPERAVRTERAISIGQGWSLVHPFVWVIDEHAGRWSALWLASWFALLGWAAGLGGRRFGSMMALGGMVTLIGVGWLVALPVTVAELGAALAGLLVGWLVAERTAPRPTGAERGA